MAVIGYDRAKHLMQQLDWKLRVTMNVEEILQVVLYHPNQSEVYTVRKVSYKKLYPECRVIGQGENMKEAILCYDHAGADESLI